MYSVLRPSETKANVQNTHLQFYLFKILFTRQKIIFQQNKPHRNLYS